MSCNHDFGYIEVGGKNYVLNHGFCLKCDRYVPGRLRPAINPVSWEEYDRFLSEGKVQPLNLK